MNLKTNLKLGEVNNLTDARFAAGAGADFVGFNFNPEHPNFLDSENFKEIAGWIDGPIMVAEWDDQPLEYILEETENLGLEVIQLNHFDAEYAKQLCDFSLIQNLNLDGCQTISDIIGKVDAVQKYVKYFMLCFHNPVKQESFLSNHANEVLLTEFCRDYPVIFQFQFTKDNLISTIEKYNPFGINLRGGLEIRPGFKDFDTLVDLVELLEK